uniref:Zinc finger and BTB domain containing 5 n=1 Tax=Myripristis murdjan TaxID=586833 RepID=A0A667WRD0_9TELE
GPGLESTSHPCMFLLDPLNHQRLHAQLCDCVVVVGGQSFQAHRSILAASSSHFRALLRSRGPSVMELDPEVVTPEAFSTLLDMIYTSTLSLGASNVMDVLLAASHLHLNTVVKACKLHLSKRNFPASPPKGWRSVQQPQEPLSSQVATTAPSGSQLQRSGGEAVVKVKVGEEGEEEGDEQKMAVIEKLATASPAEGDHDVSTLKPQLCTDLQTDTQTEGGGVGEESIDGEGLDSLSELAFSCFLNPSSESVMGALEVEDSGGSGALAFRRIAPKAVPGSEACSDPDPSSSSGSAGDSADRPALTRASEDVLSKCKKAAAEDHVLLVEGEKKYACKICCKTFMNLTDCKKHIRVHTGEKPYPCPKCGKRFSQSSHLYKHSKNTCLNWKGDNQPFPDTLI